MCIIRKPKKNWFGKIMIRTAFLILPLKLPQMLYYHVRTNHTMSLFFCLELQRMGEDDHDLQDGSYHEYSSFEATFSFLTFLYNAVILVKNTGVLMLLCGVVEDRSGWPWPQEWFLPWLFIIWSNFCFLNILVLCCYFGQEHRGPYAPIWSCKG